MNCADQYNEEYFNEGVQKRISLYQNYSWLPEISLALAFRIIELMKIQDTETILDHGCAHGFVVKALRLLYREAYGVDISTYAVEHAPEEVKQYIYLVQPKNHIPCYTQKGYYDVLLSRDVFEHIPYEDLQIELHHIREVCKRAFVVVPLAENGRYVIPSAELDITHIIREDAFWWLQQFRQANFIVKDSSFWKYGIKTPNYEKYKTGYLFAFLE